MSSPRELKLKAIEDRDALPPFLRGQATAFRVYVASIVVPEVYEVECYSTTEEGALHQLALACREEIADENDDAGDDAEKVPPLPEGDREAVDAFIAWKRQTIKEDYADDELPDLIHIVCPVTVWPDPADAQQ